MWLIVGYHHFDFFLLLAYPKIWDADTNSKLCIRRGQYTAWCFEDVRLADEDQDYRAMMTGKKKERLEEKQRRLEERKEREVEARKLLGLI